MNWQGNLRAPLTDTIVYPRTERPLTTWIGVGGSPRSIVRAAHYGLPVMLAIIGGDPARFRPYVDMFAKALGQFGKPALPMGVHSPGFIAETDKSARDIFFPHYRDMHAAIGAERGWPPLSLAAFEHEIDTGSLYVGAPDTIARKIAHTADLLGIARFQLKYSAGTLPHGDMMRCIDLYATEVAPRVRALLTPAQAAAE